jgi:hypothetical protein
VLLVAADVVPADEAPLPLVTDDVPAWLVDPLLDEDRLPDVPLPPEAAALLLLPSVPPDEEEDEFSSGGCVRHVQFPSDNDSRPNTRGRRKTRVLIMRPPGWERTRNLTVCREMSNEKRLCVESHIEGRASTCVACRATKDGMMKRREFLKHSATGAAALLLPSACILPSGGRAEPTGQPRSWTLRSDGKLVFVAQQLTLEVDREANVVWMVRGNSRVALGEGTLNQPHMALLQPGTGRVHVVDRGNHRIQVFALNGALLQTMGLGTLFMPGGIAFAADGNLLVADTFNHRVVAFTADGRVARTLGGPDQLNAPSDVTVDQDGLLHVLDAGNGRVVAMDDRGAVQWTYAPAAGRFRCATAISTGTDGAIYVAEAHGASVLAFHPRGNLLAVHRPVENNARVTPLGLSFGDNGDLHVSGLTGAPV